MDKIYQTIYALENDLLKPEIRNSPEKLQELLDENFIEYCASGKIYQYKKGEIIEKSRIYAQEKWEIMDFSVHLVAENVISARYKLYKYNLEGQKPLISLRSSIWKFSGDNWKMMFHQGTPK